MSFTKIREDLTKCTGNKNIYQTKKHEIEMADKEMEIIDNAANKDDFKV